MQQYFQNFEYEIKINIYKYIDFPLNLALTCRNWSVISKDAYAKTEWLLVRYGKSHALFHAVRLGPTFIDIPVCKTLITRKVPISRYFIQRLLMHFGKYDQKLIELKIEHNVGQLDADRIRAFQQKIKSPWASNLPYSPKAYQLDLNSDPYPSKDGFENNRRLTSLGALLILFSPTPASDWSCPSIEMVISRLVELINLGFSLKDNVIIDALRMFEHRLNEIETSCGTLSLQFDQAKQPIRNIPKDENNRQLNVIARGIFIVPDLVNLWKQIGYYEICFSLKDNVIIDALHMFEHRLDEIGDILWDAFLAIRSGGNVYSLALKFFREACKSERN
ncbi:hypothetical protein GLOIN_2v1490054 [Rhizophagus irregularis DAOM 181602=DAOM 197198]|nr:hypothetical protein GLOIN_2v1490054 [Rhizophagus irregularis DAOM 181602=DAOM 197198]